MTRAGASTVTAWSGSGAWSSVTVPAPRSTIAVTRYQRRAVRGRPVLTRAGAPVPAPAWKASAPASSRTRAQPARVSSAQVPMIACGRGAGRTGTRVGWMYASSVKRVRPVRAAGFGTRTYEPASMGCGEPACSPVIGVGSGSVLRPGPSGPVSLEITRTISAR